MIIKSINPKFNHIFKMTSDFGFYQFAKRTKPNLKYGYSIDDQSRALILATKLYNQNKKFKKLIKIYLNFIENAQEDSGTFHNFFDFKKRPLKEVRSDDCYGRTMWALGYLLSSNIKEFQDLALKIWDKAIKYSKNIRAIRSKSFLILGLNNYLEFKKDKESLKLLEKLSNDLLKEFQKNSDPNWQWFENKLIYSNAIMPLALLKSYKIIRNKKYYEVAIKSLNFLNKTCIEKGKPSPIGFENWYQKDHKKSLFGQQPIDVSDMVFANLEAYNITKDKKYKREAYFWFSWFFGNNLLNEILYDSKTGGCKDGLFEKKINSNEGAESTILFHLANLYLNDLERNKL